MYVVVLFFGFSARLDEADFVLQSYYFFPIYQSFRFRIFLVFGLFSVKILKKESIP